MARKTPQAAPLKATRRTPAPNRARPQLVTSPVADAPRSSITGMIDGEVLVDNSIFPYQVYVPRDYAARAKWPVILFLHGAGERGSDGLLQTEVGIGPALRRFAARYPAIVVMPQAPEQSRWTGPAGTAALAALDMTLAAYRTDANRVYLTGLSMGGEGAWYLAYHQHKRFAALLAVCGWVGTRLTMQSFVPDGPGTPHERMAAAIVGLPTWIVHGEADAAVPVEESRLMAQALAARGSPVTYTELPGINHNSWDACYQSQQIATWLFAQKKGRRTGPRAV